jgi:hypothetical protein
MPGVDGKLAGDDGRSRLVAVLDDLHRVPALAGGEPGGARSSRISRSAFTSCRESRGKRPSPWAGSSSAKSRGRRW